MYSPVVPMVIANLTATGCALLLTRRGPSPRLRLLTLTVGMMSLAQTTHFLYTQGVWAGGELYMRYLHHGLMAGFSLLAIYLLGKEILDRNLTDRRLRLAEHEVPRVDEGQSVRAIETLYTSQTRIARDPSVSMAGYHPSPIPQPQSGNCRPIQSAGIDALIAPYEPTDRRLLHFNAIQASKDLLRLLQQVACSGAAETKFTEPSATKAELVRV